MIPSQRVLLFLLLYEYGLRLTCAKSSDLICNARISSLMITCGVTSSSIPSPFEAFGVDGFSGVPPSLRPLRSLSEIYLMC